MSIVAAKASRMVFISFSPKSKGVVTQNLVVTLTGGEAINLAFQGRGVDPLGAG